MGRFDDLGDTAQDKVPPRFEDKADRITFLLSEYKEAVTLTLLAAIILFASGRLGLPEIPDWWVVVFEGVLIGTIPAAILSKALIIDRFIPDPRINVGVIDLPNKAIWTKKVTRNLWNRRQSGELPVWEPEDGDLDYVVSKFDYLDDVGTLKVEGVNRELVDPLSMIVRDQHIEEIHEDLQYKAAELDRYKARERTRRIDYDQRIVSSLMAAVEHGLEFEPGTMESIQDDEQDKIEGSERIDTPSRTDDRKEVPTLNELLGYEQGADQQAATDGGSDQ